MYHKRQIAYAKVLPIKDKEIYYNTKVESNNHACTSLLFSIHKPYKILVNLKSNYVSFSVVNCVTVLFMIK